MKEKCIWIQGQSRICTEVTSALEGKKTGACGKCTRKIVLKKYDNMKSNSGRTSIASTTSKSLRRKERDNDSESDSNNKSHSNSKSLSHSNSRSHSHSRSQSNSRSQSSSRSQSNSRSNLDSRTSSNTNSTSRSNSRTLSDSRSTALSKSQYQSHVNALPSVVCIEGNKSVFTAMVGRVVKHSIFPKKQFLIFERELDENGKVAESCFKELQLERSKWPAVKNVVRVRLNRVRNNAQLSVRKKLYRKSVSLFLTFYLFLTFVICCLSFRIHGTARRRFD